MSVTRFVTAESVRRGHPDKMADQVADAVLTEILKKASLEEKRLFASRVACEVAFWGGSNVDIGGEITTNTHYDPVGIAREVIRDIGWINPESGLSYHTVMPVIKIKPQSVDIKEGVDNPDTENIGAGDQGVMIGYATKETAELMPAAITYSHELVRQVDHSMKLGELSFLRPDGKAQVTLERENLGKIIRADSVIVSVQHEPKVEQGEIYEAVREKIIVPVLEHLMDGNTRIYVNPSGRFVLGGPQSDTGFTGRKIVVDNYGPEIQVGGGAFSGKDPTKVDRSGAYAARYVAKNVVGADLADRCRVEVAYAIGIADPTEVTVDTLGTGRYEGRRLSGRRLTELEGKIAEAVREIFPLKPGQIISRLGLLNVDYSGLACYGHFGREAVPWEQLDRKQPLLQAMRL